jgi:Cytidylate kinase-like family/BON domain
VRTRQGFTDASARKYIEELDKARSRRLMEMFGSDWRDPNRYDLVLNVSKMRREGAKRVIVEAAKLEEYQPTSASIRAFNDLALAARVHATLLASDHLKGSSLEVRAEEGHVFVKGRIDHGLDDEVTMLVKKIPGVIKVTTDLYSVPPEALLGA